MHGEHVRAARRPLGDGFVRAVARGRGVSASTVRSGYGEGAVLPARPALAAGKVDNGGLLPTAYAWTPPGAQSVHETCHPLGPG